MGVCASGNAAKAESKNKAKEADIRKVLLLGAGESGKSTLFKTIQKTYGGGFSDIERADFASVVYSNVLLSMKKLCEECKVSIRSKRVKEAKAYMDKKVIGYVHNHRYQL